MWYSLSCAAEPSPARVAAADSSSQPEPLTEVGLPPNKRLKLAGAPKQGRIPFVRHLSVGNEAAVRRPGQLGARSLSAVR